MFVVDVPGAARLLLVPGVRHLNEPEAVFVAMVEGWARQQRSRMLQEKTIGPRLALVRRFALFVGSYPWMWGPGDVEDFTVSLTTGEDRLAFSTVRSYQTALHMFCEYVTDGRYGWVRECRDRFDQVPVQVCHEWNTVAHLSEYEGRPQRRPFTYDELQTLFDYLDDRVEVTARSGRKGALAALRDAQLFKTAYAFGLRRREVCQLDLADLRPNPRVPQWGTYGAVHVRYGKAARGGPPKRRTVLAVPEFDWAIAGLRQWVEEGRPLWRAGDLQALWVTERLTRVDVDYLDRRFAGIRSEVGLSDELSMHCLRHSYVTHLIEHGYPERFVTEQVGHSYASTTAIYTSVSDDFKHRALQTALARVYGKDES